HSSFPAFPGSKRMEPLLERESESPGPQHLLERRGTGKLRIQGQLFPHKPVVYLRGYLTAFLTHSPSGFPHSPNKNKRALFRAVPSAGHSRNRVLTEPVTHYRIKEWSRSPMKSLRIILMLRK
uniref:Uncharacterized protein n=1 Tax=Geospiza parvula TaxID=87175 RepID=A0A8C3N955_GEOPR